MYDACNSELLDPKICCADFTVDLRLPFRPSIAVPEVSRTSSYTGNPSKHKNSIIFRNGFIGFQLIVVGGESRGSLENRAPLPGKNSGSFLYGSMVHCGSR